MNHGSVMDELKILPGRPFTDPTQSQSARLNGAPTSYVGHPPHRGFQEQGEPSVTLEQLEEELPNGLHDAQIRSITRDFENGTITLEVRILTGLPHDPPEKRNAYRNGSITFIGVTVFVIEAPEASSAFLAPGTVYFNVRRTDLGSLPAGVVGKLKPGNDMYSFFVLDWHSDIHLAASDMTFGWEHE